MQEISRYSENLAIDKLIAPKNIPQFPLKTYKEFINFEQLLREDQAVSKYMVRRLACLGGSGMEAATRRILKFLMTNELGKQFNWKGRFNKIGFENTTTMNIVLEAAKLNFPMEEKNDLHVACSVKEWLKHSTTRLNHGQKQAN